MDKWGTPDRRTLPKCDRCLANSEALIAVTRYDWSESGAPNYTYMEFWCLECIRGVEDDEDE